MMTSGVASNSVALGQRLRGVNDWLKAWQATASRRVLASVEATRLTLHSSATADWIFSVAWSGDSIVVTEAQRPDTPYRFTAMKAALAFLDALLLNHVADLAEPADTLTLSDLPMQDAR